MLRSCLLPLLFLGVIGFAGCSTTGPKGETQMCCADCSGGDCCAEGCCGQADCVDCASCVACNGGTSETSASEGDVAVIVAGGMGCPLCASSAEKQLTRLPGVRSTRINLGTGELHVAVDPSQRPSDAELAQAVTDGGFTVESVRWHKGGEQ